MRTILLDAAKRWPKAPIVVTSRPIGGRRPAASFRELTLLPFSDDDRRDFLVRWLGDERRAEEALGKLAAVRTLWELAGNPLYLTLLALLIEEGEKLPERRAQLYDLIFDFLLDGKHHADPEPIEPRPVVEDALKHLAWGMTEANHDAEPAKYLARRLWDDDTIRRDLNHKEAWKDRPQAFLDEVAKKTSLLAEHDGPRRGWRFWHRTFREALVAERLEALLSVEGEAALLEHARHIAGDEGRWAEPYALLVGRLGPGAAAEPDALFLSLMATNRALGLRALTTVKGLRRKTIQDLFETLAKGKGYYGEVQGWEARAVVYRRIPQLLGEARASLELLESLRRQTTDGNDLFFVDLAMVEVGKRWPEAEVQGEVTEARGRIFDHLAQPERFSEVAIPVDALWREIPEGSFKMGSPSSENGYPEERPRHEVRVESPFEMDSIPVTNAQYRIFDPSHEAHRWHGVDATELGDHPVVNVTWYAAVMFCRWLAAHLPGVRLATEEEWEYACRAGTSTRYWSGDEEADLKRVGWYRANSSHRTHRVGELEANPWGLFDVHGNVWEWTQSPSTSNYKEHKSGRTIDPAAISAVSPADLAGDAGATPGGGRVWRGGGCWFDAGLARSAYRGGDHPGGRYRYLGFRLVRPARRPEG